MDRAPRIYVCVCFSGHVDSIDKGKIVLKFKIPNPKSKINPKSKFIIPKPKFCDLIFVLSHYFVICALLFVVYISNCYAASISSTELINNASQHDGETVVYQGEVIGDIMVRGEYCWVNINDGINAIGIWADKDLTKDILYTGGYRSKGDIVKVTGIFNRACLEHGGDLDIHAKSLRKITTGEHFQEKLNVRKINFAIGLLVILCLIWILTLLKRK